MSAPSTSESSAFQRRFEPWQPDTGDTSGQIACLNTSAVGACPGLSLDPFARRHYHRGMASDSELSAALSRRDLVTKLGMAMVVFGSETKRRVGEGSLTQAQTRRLLPAGLLAAIGGEIASTVAYLAMARWAYGSASLVRQLVEVEYLSWAITNDSDDAWEWFTSNRATRLERWQPGKIRQRSEGRFPNSDYHDHCEAGGHPVPQPAMQILDNRDIWVEVTLYEAALHGSATWHYLLRAVEDLGPLPEIDRQHRVVDQAYEAWRAVEHLAGSFSTADGD